MIHATFHDKRKKEWTPSDAASLLFTEICVVHCVVPQDCVHQFGEVRVCGLVDRDCPVLHPQLCEPHVATFPISVNTLFSILGEKAPFNGTGAHGFDRQ